MSESQAVRRTSVPVIPAEVWEEVERPQVPARRRLAVAAQTMSPVHGKVMSVVDVIPTAKEMEGLTVRQLLYGLLLPSGADAAYALARAYGPGLSAFVATMNATARLLGMRRTHFSNFDGLPYPTSYSNYSTAANLLVLGRAAMRLPAFRAVVDQRGYRLAAGSGHHAYRWKNLNPLIGRYPGAIGIKPGYTRAAGQCLLFEATRNGHSVIGVTLHSPGSISTISPADATRILNWAFATLS